MDKTGTTFAAIVCTLLALLFVAEVSGIRQSAGNELLFVAIPIALILACLVIMWVRMRRL